MTYNEENARIMRCYMLKNHIILQTNQGWYLQRLYVDNFHNRMLVKSFYDNSAASRARLHYEFSHFSTSNNPWLLKPLAVETVEQRYGLIYENFDGVPFSQFQKQHLTFVQFLELALELCNLCIYLHQDQILFLSLHPHHILIHPESLKIKVISSDASMKYSASETLNTTPSYQSIQPLYYYAPEQTGRLTTKVDYRTDLYSLGLLFYELLSNTPLFEGQNAVDVVYDILTKKPSISPKARTHAPAVIWSIIEKLLEKNPEQRYKSALGLKEDLLFIKQSFLSGETLENFMLGEKDVALSPTLASNWYGRELEKEQLLSSFHHILHAEKSHIILQGDVGVGKTQIVHDLKGAIAAAKGYFVETKYMQLPLENNATQIIAPLRDLLKQIYMEGEASVSRLKLSLEKIELYMSLELMDFLPELKWFYNIANISPLFYEDTKQLQAYLFSSMQKIYRAVTLQKKPIVLFIDDAQWADQHSLEAILNIYEQIREGYFMLIMAWRSTSEYPIPLEVRPTKFITIHNMSIDDITQWLDHSLPMAENTRNSMTSYLYHMTNGNPLFIKEVFQLLMQESAIELDVETKQWVFHQEHFQHTALNSELLTFLTNKIMQLPPKTLELLQLCACLGNSFSYYLIRRLAKIPTEELASNLDILLAKGFIVSHNANLKWEQQLTSDDDATAQTLTFQFMHSRVQQAAYSTLSSSEQQRWHCLIGRLYALLIKQNYNLSQVQEAVKHFNHCPHILNEEERQLLIKWNYDIGIQTKQIGLYKNALYFLNNSRSLLADDCWRTMAEDSLNIFIQLGECHCLLGQYEIANTLLSEALLHCQTTVQELAIYNLKTLLYIESDDPYMSVEAGLTGLAIVNKALPKNPSKLHVAKELIKLHLILQTKTSDDLLKEALPNQQEQDYVIQILIHLVASTVRYNSNLTALTLIRTFRLQLKNGFGPKGALTLANYGMLLSAGLGDMKGAMKYGQLSVEMANKQDSLYVKGHVYYVYGLFISHWADNYETSLHYMNKAQQYCREIGLHVIFTTASCFIVVVELMRGTAIHLLEKEIVYQQQEFSQEATALTRDFLHEMALWVKVLKNSEQHIEWAFSFEIKDQPIINFMHYVIRLQMSYLLQNEQQATQLLALLKTIEKDIFDLPITANYYFYRTLWHFDLQEKTNARKEIDKGLRKFKKWHKIAPQRYSHFYYTLLAESNLANNKKNRVAFYYDRAIQLAKMHGFIQDYGIICERAARFYMAQKNEESAIYYGKEAIQAMRQWGAETVAQRWETVYMTPSFAPQEYSEYYANNFELMTFLETAQSFAQHIQMEELLENVLFAILKHANASVGYFIYKTQEEFIVLAKAEAEQRLFSTYEQQMLEYFSANMQSIVRYAVQSETHYIIQNTALPDVLLRTSTEAKSILCLPIHHKNNIVALLYLENTLTPYSFNASHIDILKILSTQIAISIENAKVYEQLEQHVLARTQEVEQANIHLQQMNEQLAKNEQDRKKLFHSISHELRSPITSSLGYIDLILDGVISSEEDKEKYLIRGRERLLSLNTLIEDLFDLANLESGRVEYEMASITAYQLFEQFEDRFEHEIKERGLHYERQFFGVEDVSLLVDMARIQQVFDNILLNAMKYTADGFISVTMETTAQAFICKISDSGIGIPASDLPFIFESYYKASNVHIKNSHGIGLSICQHIIHHHGGEIFVTSKEQHGSTFSFHLPLLHK